MIASSRGDGLRDLFNVDQRLDLFDQALERYLALAAQSGLDLCEQGVDPEDVARRLDLRNNDDVEKLAGLLDDFDHVLVGVFGLDIVHAEGAGFLAPVKRLQRLDHLAARLDLLVGGDRVFEIEKDHVGLGAERALDHLLVAAGRG